MKAFFLLIPLVLFSCKKVPSNTDHESVAMQGVHSDKKNDSKTPKTDDSTVDNKAVGLKRTVKDDQINISIDASSIPIEFEDVFTKDGQSMNIEIKNYNKPHIEAEILPRYEDLNIRFNGIGLPNGDSDGPFGRSIKYDLPEKGDVSLSIYRNNMAEGKLKGVFKVIIK